MTAPLLVVDALSKSFGGVHAVRDVSFTVAPGETVAIIGPNGAGKTTCFNLIHGELTADSGDVRFDGRTLLHKSTHAIARRGVGRSFQVAATFASMTVRESVALALVAHDGRDSAARLSRMPCVASATLATKHERRHGDSRGIAVASLFCANGRKSSDPA